MTENLKKPKGAMPKWLAITLIVFAVAGGAYTGVRLYQSMDTKRPTMQAVVVEDPFAAQRDGPFKRAGGIITAHRNNTYFSASPREDSYTVAISYTEALRKTWMRAELKDVHIQLLRILSSARLSQEINLTAEQRQALLKLPSHAVRLTDDERQNLAALAREWDSATGEAKSDARDKLLAAIVAAGEAHLEQTRANWIARATEASKILQPEQIAAARKFDPAAPPKPAAPAVQQVAKPAP
jgi:hypothetical protein